MVRYGNISLASDGIYAIDSANGDKLADGLAAHNAIAVALEKADRLGQSVYVYDTQDGEDAEMIEVAPTGPAGR